MIDKVNHPRRMASDVNNYLIAMWRYLCEKDYDFPREVSRIDFVHCRDIFNEGLNGDGTTLDEAIVGWVGAVGSTLGKFYNGSYCITTHTKRDYIKEHINNILAQKDKLKGVVFACGSYDEIDIPPHSVIYCDPPYQDTTKYASQIGTFHSEDFFQWCREKNTARQ